MQRKKIFVVVCFSTLLAGVVRGQNFFGDTIRCAGIDLLQKTVRFPQMANVCRSFARPASTRSYPLIPFACSGTSELLRHGPSRWGPKVLDEALKGALGIPVRLEWGSSGVGFSGLLVGGPAFLWQPAAGRALAGRGAGYLQGRLGYGVEPGRAPGGAGVPANRVVAQFGFFCKRELELEKTIHLPLRFRLGSLQ